MKVSLKSFLPFLMLAIIATACRTQKITNSVDDEKAIREVLGQFELAFEKRDATIYAMNFREDADWENAFGNREKGRENIKNRISGVYKMFQQANQIIKEIRIRFITPNVAVADVDREIVGQVNEGGDKKLPLRKVRTTQVLRKEKGEWKVVVFRVADLRNPEEVR